MRRLIDPEHPEDVISDEFIQEEVKKYLEKKGWEEESWTFTKADGSTVVKKVIISKES